MRDGSMVIFTLSSCARRSVATTTVVTVALFLFQATALAQESPADPGAETARRRATLEEVIVTSTRREEALHRIPLSVTAFSTEDLAARGTDDLQDLLIAVASVDYAAILPGLATINIRGISAPIGESTVGLYIDEVPITGDLGGQPDIKTFDVARVEVVRGPQGTLYGEGSMGGTVRIITSKPQLNDWNGSAEAVWKSTDHGGTGYSLSGMLNAPLVDGKLGLKLVGIHREMDGFIDNTQLGINDINDEETTGGRASLRWRPTERLTLDGTVLFQSTEVGGVFIADRDYQQVSSVREPRDDDYYLYNLTASHRADSFEFISSTSYWDRSTTRVVATRGTAFLPLLEGLIFLLTGEDVSPLTSIHSDLDIDYKIFTQEFRLVSTAENRLRWTLGAFYKDSERVTFQNSVTDGPNIAQPFGLIFGNSTQEFDQIAAYGEVGFDLTKRLAMTVGARVFRQEQTSLGEETGVLAGAGAATDGKVTIDGVTPKFALSYSLSDEVLFYANAAQGFRGGGVNGTLVVTLGAPPTFEEDTLWQYEVGVRTLLLDQRLALSGALYWIDWQDFQTLGDSSTTGGFAYTVNGGGARSRGLDLEVQARPTPYWELTGGYSYTDSELVDDTISAPSGTPLPFVSRHKVSASVQRAFPISARLTGVARFDYGYSSKREGTIVNTPASQAARGFLRNPSYQVGNFRAGVSTDRWQVYAFMNNIWNERISYFHVFAEEGAPSFVNEPRNVGIAFRMQL